MAVPKRKVSRARRGKRRSHQALTAPCLSYCAHCGEPKLPHRICPDCATYKGKDFEEKEEME